jgi:hypothetical protein
MDALLGVMRTITQTWGMSQNSAELASAVHVLQGFIVQHMLHRLAPEHWSAWTQPQGARPAREVKPMTDVDGKLRVEGPVSIDGDCIYVNGMTLANLIRAFTPPDTGGNHYNRGLVITIEERP